MGYTDDQVRRQALVLRLEKTHVRAVLVSLETRAGRKIQYRDAEARKAGMG